MAVYATWENVINRFDKRLIRDLCSDDGQPIDEDDLDTNEILTKAITGASGEVESAVMVGEFYSPDQLAALTGNSQELLIDLTCELTFLRLIRRRGEKYSEDYKDMRKSVMDWLERLRKGQNVFNVAANIQSGTVAVTGPTTIAIEQLNLMRDRVGTAYYPRRRMPYGR